MRPIRLLAATAALAAASPAAAQLSNRSISVESGVSLPSGDAARPSIPVAIAATTWLDGSFDAVARLALGAAAETPGRPATRRVEATAGVRWSRGTDALRPQLQLELGWAGAAGDGAAPNGLAAGVGAGVEWFARRDVALAVRTSLRRAPGERWRPELTFGASYCF